jgi:hypothetical protein
LFNHASVFNTFFLISEIELCVCAPSSLSIPTWNPVWSLEFCKKDSRMLM